jgi:hypothetical protein
VIGRSPYFTFGEAPAPAQVMPATTTKTVPFDYAFQFALTGRPTNKLQDVVEISMEGMFVAVALGYSVVADESVAPPTFTPTVNLGLRCSSRFSSRARPDSLAPRSPGSQEPKSRSSTSPKPAIRFLPSFR